MKLELHAAGTRSAWAGVLLLLAACGGPRAPGPDVAAQAQPIINGKTDTGDTPVAMLYVQYPDGSGYLCSGEIIGPHTFLTAAHCALGFSSNDLAVVTNATDALAALGNPDGGSWHLDRLEAYSGYKPGGAGDWHDIGIGHIVEEVPGPYLAVNRYPLERLVVLGQPVREVGYGITGGYVDGGQGEGTRRSVTKKDVNTRGTGELLTGNAPGLTCSGDSGGPALFKTPDGVTTIIGVTSRGDDGCAQEGIDTRPDPYLDWIATFMADHGDSPSCGADGRCGFHCPAPDPDCPCAPDGLCTSACATPEADPDCPQSCLFDGGTCIPPPPPPKPPPPIVQPQYGCQSAGGLALWPLLVIGLSQLRRRVRLGRFASPSV